MLCLKKCKDNGGCDVDRGFVCVEEACVCDPNNLKALCHKECYKAADCDQKKDKDGNPLFPTSQGYTCEMPMDLNSGGKPGTCKCPEFAQCAKASESTGGEFTQESSEFGGFEWPGSESGGVEQLGNELSGVDGGADEYTFPDEVWDY